MTAVSIRLPDDVADRLDRLLALTGRTQTSFITEAVLEHLDDLEDLYAAEQRLGEIRAGRTRPIPIKEVRPPDPVTKNQQDTSATRRLS